MKHLTGYSLLLIALLVSTGCASKAPPERQSNACEILQENRSWYSAIRKTAKKWGAPMGLQLAIIKQESSFRHDAKPPRGERRMLGLLPGKRPSTAYGYAQALDITWSDYQRATGNRSANRDDFDDAVDFIGWYIHRTGRKTGIGQFDYRSHYLAYHEGPGGYTRGTWRSKRWLIDTANRVHTNADRYEKQIQGCRKKLKKRWLFW